MTKKKLLLVVGAGASIDFGMPSVKEAGEIINTTAQEWFPLADEPRTNLYKHIEQMIKGYWCEDVPKHLRRDPQFEDILTISELMSAYPAGAYTSPLGALISVKELPDIKFGGYRRKVDQYQISHFCEFAFDALLHEIRDRCKRTSRNFTRLQSFVTTLQNTFEVATVTINYDDILYRALFEIETGFDPHTGHFEEKRIYGRRGWPCILHLHGSVHFNMPTPQRAGDDIHEILWESNIEANFASNTFGRSPQLTQGGQFPTSAIIAGYGKTAQISLRRPFRTYYSELDRLVWECDAVLFAGYGFGDEHLNIAFEGFSRDDRHRPVAIIEKRIKPCLDPRNDSLGWYLHNKLNLRLGPIGFCTFDKQKLLTEKEFDSNNDPQRPLSVWHFGMLDACDNSDKVIAVLDSK